MGVGATPAIVVPGTRWHLEVPGARWFRADLHIHTLDDHFSPNLKWPSGISGKADAPDVQRLYARRLLQSAITQGIEVLGLTPHCPRSGTSDDSSATWRIVQEWMTGVDDDGTPFTEKIYAVFPGFEPSLADGARGVHLLFLFDPSIGRDAYLRAFQAVMGGAAPWEGNNLRMSPRSAREVFESILHLRKEEKFRWDWMCIAPHAFQNDKGLFALKSQMLENFPHDYISALELGDNTLPDDALTGRPWMLPEMERHHHAFVHSSDAYSLPSSSVPQPGQLGFRFTLVKLAKPTIEALRQAMLARDSRLRIAYCKDLSGQIASRADLPEATASDRPWLQRLTISGGTSFFAGNNPQSKVTRTQTFSFSPDLTVVIGGRMSGKSTLLDGLRTHFGRPLPVEEQVKKDVVARATQRFQSGNPTLTEVVRGPISTSEPLSKRWPCEFFTQRELQQAVKDQKGLRKILYHLVPSSTALLLESEARLADLDSRMASLVKDAEKKREEVADAEQALATAAKAKQTLETFKQVGAGELSAAQKDAGLVANARKQIAQVQNTVAQLAQKVKGLKLPSLVAQELQALLSDGSVTTKVRKLRASVRYAGLLTTALERELSRIDQLAESREQQTKQHVQNALVHAGGSTEDLNRFDDLSRLAAGYEAAASRFEACKKLHVGLLRQLAELSRQRRSTLEQHRTEMEKLALAVADRFGGTIQLSQIMNGIQKQMEDWLLGLREKGVTRWWNELGEDSRPQVSPETLLRALRSNQLGNLGMSTQVASTFRDCMTANRRLCLHSLRNDDYYELQLRVADNPPAYKRMDELSGGAQVSVLLTLLLSSENPNPLVIDQPEDELDKSYLRETVLPALRRLKGRRQVILATHDANIVVNGDADQVIYLKATHNFAEIAEQDAIENTIIKNAVIELLDGGSKAFELRKEKYGF